MSFWGDNRCPACVLYSCLAFSKPKTKSINRIGPHDYYINEIIVGSLLGDSYAEKRHNGTRICFQQESSNMEYFHDLWKLFADHGYTSNDKPTAQGRLGKDAKKRNVYRFKTWTFSSFNYYHGIFYKNGVKVVPLNITTLLTPLALAIWIMDDGCKQGKGLRIATNSFTLSEVQLLCDALLTLNIKATPVKNGTSQKTKETQYNVYISVSSMVTLRSLVQPFFVPSMLRKLGL